MSSPDRKVVYLRSEVDGVTDHLASLADARGWWTTEIDHALAVDVDTVEAWTDAGTGGAMRPATPEDVEAIRAPARGLYERLGFRHEVAFVGYRSWEQ